MSVPRFRPYYFDPRNQTGHDATMRQNSKGDYVLHSDYAELEAGVAEVFRMVHYHRADWTDIDAALERLMRLTSETGAKS